MSDIAKVRAELIKLGYSQEGETLQAFERIVKGLEDVTPTQIKYVSALNKARRRLNENAIFCESIVQRSIEAKK